MAEARYDVVGIGSAIVDILSRTDDDFIAAQGMSKGTMALITADQAKALYDKMGKSMEMSGGSAANTMAGIAALGGKPAFIGKVGADRIGEIFAHDIKVIGVYFHGGAARPTKLPSAMSLILVTPDAQRTMNTYLGACTELGPDDIDAQLIADSHVTYIEGYQWDTPRAKQAIRKACQAASKAKRKVALSLSDPFVVERHRGDLSLLIEDYVDLIFGNQDEVFRLFQVNSFEEAVTRLRQTNTLACMTRGAKGAVVIDGATTTEVPAAPIAKVVDTTGAGDLFAAGFLYGFTHGRDLAHCAKLGALAAAEIISHMGARPEADLRELMTKAGL
ncbi:MAG: adenosine kinase [Alphaproteobacteria bacterium]|nr:adenosine kinase [Alphaproteobacteria bacterium]